MVRGAMPLFMLRLTLAVGLVGLLSAISVLSHQPYQNLIPNGYRVTRSGVRWPAVGHTAPFGRNLRNSFGDAFAAAGNTYTNDLCMADSDGDGYSNGRELGDPECTWTTGATPSSITGISHPGYADSTPPSEAAETSSGQSGSQSSHAFIPHCWFPVLGAFVALMLFNAW